MNTTARTLRSSATATAAGLLLAATGSVLAPGAKAAAAADTEPPELTVSTAAPAEIGLAGGPVGFTTTAANTGTHDASSARLIYHIDGGEGLPPNAVSLQYKLGAATWKPVSLALTGTQFSGELPETFPLAAGEARTVRLRLGLPMGTPHNGDSNGGTDHLRLTTLVSYGAGGMAGDTDEDTVEVGALTTALSGVPATATPGGPGVTFGATVSNPTASAYENVTEVLFTSRDATVQELRSGTWKTLRPIADSAEPDVYGFDVIGKDAALAAHSSTSVKVRVTYGKAASQGKTTVHPCVFVNEGSAPFTGSTFCGSSSSLTLKAVSATTTPTASATATASPLPSATAATTTSGGTTTQLAETGSGGASATTTAAAALVTAGAGLLGLAALRRRRDRT
uniref:Gram-positive cocci surface proteins LPxTG domain-containing protein n=1 Tax=Streptomyces sp. NBC_00008 TaxID=2903610 RepID=A0AAU2W205_9ACTN